MLAQGQKGDANLTLIQNHQKSENQLPRVQKISVYFFFSQKSIKTQKSGQVRYFQIN